MEANMKDYKALVTDWQGKKKIIDGKEYKNKADFIADLRRNEYKVNPLKVKEAEEFDRIMEHTNCEEWDWNPNKFSWAFGENPNK